MTFREQMKNTLCVLMAGGRGERLYPLTKDRAKPAVRFGGIYRIVDFTLSNCLNSDIRRIYVLTQYRSVSLDRHIRMGWSIFNHELDEFIECIPPQQRNVERWYRGTSDSIYQNIHILQRERPERVLILSGDHVYKMNYNEMLRFHIENNAELTVAGVEVPRGEASAFGIIGCDDDYRITSWVEKPKNPEHVPGKPDLSFVSMGVYIFNTDVLVKNVITDAKDGMSDHDFGKNVVPRMIAAKSRVFVHRFRDAGDEGSRYWRDIGTIDAYWAANMDLCSPEPQCNLHDPKWPIRTCQEQVPPAKTLSLGDPDVDPTADGVVESSIISGGCLVRGGKTVRSVLSHNVEINSGALVEDSVLLYGVRIGPRAKVRKAIIDHGVEVPEGFVIGYDSKEDAKRFALSAEGVITVPRGITLR
ncbi:MAG: glucose-1-phosphate adenylyltransferase [Pseudomonadota bacterium]